MPVVLTSAKGQVIIPVAVRKAIGLRPGTKVQVTLGEQGTVILRPLPADPIEAACGFLKGGPSLTTALAKARQEERSREEARGARLVRSHGLPRKGTRVRKRSDAAA